MKPGLRKQLRAARRSFSSADHALRSKQAAKYITQSRQFRAGKRVALYLPFDRETDTAALLVAARRRGVRLFVPVIVDRRHGRIRFYPLKGKTRSGVFGIAVPLRNGPPVAAQWLDLIVVPLVGVDDDGRRLGMGGGYYDRALRFRRRRRRWAGPCVAGFAFDSQRTASRFADSWDVRLDCLATESGLHRFHETPA